MRRNYGFFDPDGGGGLRESSWNLENHLMPKDGSISSIHLTDMSIRRYYIHVWVSSFHVVKILFLLLPEISSEAVEMVLITHKPKKV